MSRIHKNQKPKNLSNRFLLDNKEYLKVLKEFKENLKIIGYAEGTQHMLPTLVTEFLYRLEEKGLNRFDRIEQNDIIEHYEYLKERPNFRKDGGLSSMMIQHHIYSLKLFFAHLEKTGRIKYNPISALTFPKPESKERQILTVEEVKELYDVSENLIDKAILGIAYGCGLRRSEITRLDIRDIAFRSFLLYVREGKGCKRRVVPMPKKVGEDLKSYYLKERSSYIRRTTKDNQVAFLLNVEGNRMKGETCNKRLKCLIQLTDNSNIINKEISLHSLRHSIATHLLDSGLGIESVQEFLGHSGVDSTQIYTRVSKSQLKKL
jgi:integrase/recombinase XerD